MRDPAVLPLPVSCRLTLSVAAGLYWYLYAISHCLLCRTARCLSSPLSPHLTAGAVRLSRASGATCARTGHTAGLVTGYRSINILEIFLKVVDEQSLRRKASTTAAAAGMTSSSRVSAADSMDNVNLEDSSTTAGAASSTSPSAGGQQAAVRGRTFRECREL